MALSRFRLARKPAPTLQEAEDDAAGAPLQGTPEQAPRARPPRRLRRRTVVAVGAAVALTAPAAIAATSYHEVDINNPDGEEAEDRWGERMAAADLDDDGDADDLLVGVPQHDVNGTSNAGKVYAIDGAKLPDDPADPTLYSVTSNGPEGELQPDARFGYFLSVLGDVNDDGSDDYVVGSNSWDVGFGTDQGKAWVLSGADGTELFDLTSPDPQDGASFAERTGRAGDVNGDGFPDAVIGEPQRDIDIDGDDTLESNVGRAYVFSGDPADDGALLLTLNSPDPEVDAQFGKAVQGPGDLGSMAAAGDPSTSQDDVPDLFVNAVFADDGTNADAGRSYLFSGGDDFDDDDVLDEQELLTRIDSPDSQDNALFGFQDVETGAHGDPVPGDVGGQDSDDDGVGEPDGTPDLYAAAFHQDVGDNTNQGRAWMFDGFESIDDETRHGVPMYQLNDPKNPQAGGSFGWSMSRTDYDGDAIPDLYIGQAPHNHEDTEPSGGDGGTYVFDGTDQDVDSETEDAAVHKKLELPPECQQGGSDTNRGPALGWSNATPGNVDGDDNGQEDYVAGAPFTDLPTETDTKNAGIVIFFGSKAASDDIDDCEGSG